MASNTPEKTFNVGVIGYGMSAKIFHIPFIKLTPGLKLHAIVQRSPTDQSSAPADHPDVKHYTSADALAADPEVSLVVVSTPPNTHVALVRQALEAGKHVLVEKPFVPTSAQADELAALARERGLVLCVYQNRRWDADFTTLRRLVASGDLGRVYEFDTHFDRYRPEKPAGSWKARLGMDDGGGAVFDLGTHLLDQVYVLFGKPSRVYAKFVIQRDGRIVRAVSGEDGEEPDSVYAVLSYDATGLIVTVRIGVLSAEVRQPRFWIRGTKGSYHKLGLDAQEPQLKEGKAVTDADFGRDPSASWHGVLTRVFDDGSWIEKSLPNDEPPPTYLEFYRLLAAALASGKEEDIPVPASQAAEVLRIVEAVRRSASGVGEVALS